MRSSAPAATRQIRPVAAALFMLASVACFAMNSILVRYVSADMHPFEIAFFRNFFAAAIIVPIALWHDGIGILRARRIDLLTGRGVVNAASMIAWFYAVPLIPLADLTALGFTAPLWATILAALLLGETVRRRRWTATIVGFAGALVIIRPGFVDVSLGVWLVLFSSAMWAATTIFVRVLTGHERPGTILVYQTLMLTAISLVPALFVWEWPRIEVFGWLIVLGLLTAIAHFCHVRAYTLQEVAALQPIDFGRLPIVALAAWLVFGEIADVWVWVGAVIVFLAGAYISHREAQVKREAARAAEATRLTEAAAAARRAAEAAARAAALSPAAATPISRTEKPQPDRAE
ncbi:MAG: DMT family transporter [Alphaproteobacteria bacterium]